LPPFPEGGAVQSTAWQFRSTAVIGRPTRVGGPSPLDDVPCKSHALLPDRGHRSLQSAMLQALGESPELLRLGQPLLMGDVHQKGPYHEQPIRISCLAV